MTQLINQFHFIRPDCLLLIPLCIALLLLLWKKQSQSSSWQQLISPELLTHLLNKEEINHSKKLPLILLATTWLIAIIALAGPTWEKRSVPVFKNTQARVIILDLSDSMNAKDLQPSRLSRAKHKLDDLLSLYTDGLTGLVVYAGNAHIVSPLTDDSATIKNMVSSLSTDIMPTKGSRPDIAIQLASQLLDSNDKQGQIILITDELKSGHISAINENRKSYSISILGVGTAQGGPIQQEDGSFLQDRYGTIVVPKLNASNLANSAKKFSGRYATLGIDDKDINYLLDNSPAINKHNSESRVTVEREFDQWIEPGSWLLFIILPIALLSFRRGWYGVFLIGLLTGLPYSNEAQAGLWEDLWYTKDQQAQQAFKQQQYNQATETFTNPQWKASSAYRSGDFEAAAEQFSENTSDSYYNRGNAFAKSQRLDDAIAAYEQSLALDPTNSDAKDNKTLVERIKQQSEQQDGDQSDENKDKGDQSESKNTEKKENSDQESAKPDNSNQENSDKKSAESSPSEKQSSQQQNSPSEQQPQEEQTQQASSSEQKSPSEKNAETDLKKPQQAQEESEVENANHDEQSPQQGPVDPSQLFDTQSEKEQARKQLLRKVPDDPGGLLRQKFYYEAQEKNLRQHDQQSW